MSESPMEEEYRLRLEEAHCELAADGWKIVPAYQTAELPVPKGGPAVQRQPRAGAQGDRPATPPPLPSAWPR